MLLMHDFLETILFRDETDSERFLKKMFSNLREAFVSKKTRKRSIRLFRFYPRYLACNFARFGRSRSVSINDNIIYSRSQRDLQFRIGRWDESAGGKS